MEEKKRSEGMRASEALIRKIKEFEGFRPQAYLCPGGRWTVGYGHVRGVSRGRRVTEREADGLLREDLKQYERCVAGLGVARTQGEFDALVDFAFNLGSESLRGSTLLRKIRSGAPEAEIRAEFRRWVYGGGQILPGLVRRRQWEADRYFAAGEGAEP